MRLIDFLTKRREHLEQSGHLYRCMLKPSETGVAKDPCFDRHKAHCPEVWKEAEKLGKEHP